MNFFYKEARKKQMHYYRQGIKQTFPLADISRNTRLEKIITRQPNKMFRFSVLVSDLIALNLIFIVLHHFLIDKKDFTNQPLLIVINVAWIFSSYFNALYFGKERFLLRTIQSYLLFSSLTLLINFLLKSSFSRPLVLANFAGFGLSLAITRIIFIGAYSFLKNNMVTSKFIVLGCNELSHKLIANLQSENNAFQMAGIFDDYVPRSIATGNNHVLGSLKESVAYAIKNDVAEIYSTIPPENNPEIYEIAHEAEKNFIRFRFVPDFTIFINRRVHVSFVDDLPVLSLRSEPLEDLGSRFKKRCFDVVFSSLVILFVLSWLVPIIAILIKLDSKGPVFFKQLRSGKNNMPFLCFKFRSLTVNDESDTKQVSRNDVRYTRLGKFLRKTNLDEFPQFFNVFQGYMSVVGPRPHMLKHTVQYSEIINQYMIRHFVKPGLTGLAQVNGYRGEITKEEDLSKRIEFDIKYMENWSMILDIQLIFQTVYLSVKGDKNAF